MKQHPQKQKAHEVIQNAIEQQHVGSYLDAVTPPEGLKVESVFINGTPSEGSFVSRTEGYGNGDPTQRLDFAAKYETDISAIDPDALKKANLAAIETVFSKIPLKEAGANGEKTLADFYDFSGKPAETELSREKQLEHLRKLITDGIEEAEKNGKPIPAEQKALLEADIYKKEGSVFGYSDSIPTISGGGISTGFSVSNVGEVDNGNSNLAKVKKSIEDRKTDILESVVNKAVEARAKTRGIPADQVKDNKELQELRANLQNLDLEVNTSSYGSSANVTVNFGNKLDSLEDAEKAKLSAVGATIGSTKLADFDAKDLSIIINDSVLFAGAGARDIASVVAGPADIRRILKENEAASPNFTKALDHPVVQSELYGQELREAEEKHKATSRIVPEFTIDSGLNMMGEPSNTVHVRLDLPKDKTFESVITSIAQMHAQGTGAAEQREADKNQGPKVAAVGA